MDDKRHNRHTHSGRGHIMERWPFNLDRYLAIRIVDGGQLIVPPNTVCIDQIGLNNRLLIFLNQCS